MTLTDILRERVSRKGTAAQVLCGELGTVTVEALSPAECRSLLRSANGPRAIFYAACRELQAAGEELRRSGKLFRPEEIMGFLSEEELQPGFAAALELSDVSLPASNEPFSDIQQTLPEPPASSAATPSETAADGISHFADTHTQIPAGAPSHSNLSPRGTAVLPDSQRGNVSLVGSSPAPMQTALPDEAVLAEQVASRILDGLRQAAAVR